MNTTPPPVPTTPARRSVWQRASIIWVIPILALLVVLGVAWQSYSDRGPVIRIAFSSAEGVKAGQTELKFRDVSVGVVEKVGFSDDLSKVIADVRLDKDVAPFVDSSSSFWVVRPEVSARGITGLGTVLSGVYIEGSWDSQPDGVVYEFLGLDNAPLIRSGERGLQIALRASGRTSLSEDTPILYRGVEVGRMGQAVISKDGGYTIAEAIIYEPHDRLISKTTRFWDTSGFTFKIGAGGAELDFSSIATLISGGITFETLVSADEMVSDGTIFEVYDDETSAKASVYNASDVEPLELSAIFEDNIAGLTVGAPVELGGFKIGEISNLNGIVDRSIYGDARVRLKATMAIQPARLGLQGETTPEAALAFLSEQVRTVSLRARLASASLLTGGLKVELIEAEDGFAETMNFDDGPFPLIPVTKSEISDVSATADGVFNRINKLPIEELMISAITLFETATAFVADDNLKQAPEEVVGLIEDMRGLVGSEATQNVPIALNATLEDLRVMVSSLRAERGVERLLAAVDAVGQAAQSADTSIAGLPPLIERLNTVAANAADVPLNEVADQLSSLLVSLNAVVGTQEARELPANLSDALGELQATLTELREGGAVENVNKTLQSARVAADQIAVSVQDLPGLIDRMTRLLNQASATLQSYDGRSEFNRDARDALRDIAEAAEAVSSLARTLERNPNSLLLGR